MAVLNRNSPIPLYFQLKEYLKGEITTGRLPEGAQLPPERELAERYAISRMTARQALQELVQEGFLSRQSGRGTFVTRPSKPLRISSQGFTRDIQAMGLRPGNQVLSVAVEPATPVIAYELGTAPGSGVLRVERLQTADGEPVAHQVIWMIAARFPGLGELIRDDASLYEALRERYGVVIRGGCRLIDCVPASGREAELLRIRVGSPLLRLSGSTHDEDGLPVEHGWTVYRADRYRFHVD